MSRRPDLRVVQGHEPMAEPQGPHRAQPRARMLVVTSGADGIGKTQLAANLAVALAERGARVTLVDGDLAQGQLDLVLGVTPRWDLGHVLAGERSLDEVETVGPQGVKLIAAPAHAPELAEIDDLRRERLVRAIAGLEATDFVIVDTAAGAGRTTLDLCRLAHDLVVVATPETMSAPEAYGLVRTLHTEGALSRAPRLVVNLVGSDDEAEDTVARLQMFARHFLRLEFERLGVVPADPSVPMATRQQEPVVVAAPQSSAAVAYRALAARLWKPVPAGPDVDALPSSLRLRA